MVKCICVVVFVWELRSYESTKILGSHQRLQATLNSMRHIRIKRIHHSLPTSCNMASRDGIVRSRRRSTTARRCGRCRSRSRKIPCCSSSECDYGTKLGHTNVNGVCTRWKHVLRGMQAADRRQGNNGRGRPLYLSASRPISSQRTTPSDTNRVRHGHNLGKIGISTNSNQFMMTICGGD